MSSCFLTNLTFLSNFFIFWLYIYIFIYIDYFSQRWTFGCKKFQKICLSVIAHFDSFFCLFLSSSFLLPSLPYSLFFFLPFLSSFFYLLFLTVLHICYHLVLSSPNTVCPFLLEFLLLWHDFMISLLFHLLPHLCKHLYQHFLSKFSHFFLWLAAATAR